MASRFPNQVVRRGIRTPLFTIALGASFMTVLPNSIYLPKCRLDSTKIKTERNLRTAVPEKLSSSSSWTLARGTIQQISAGSVVGFLTGLGISTFSTSLTVLFGLLVIGVQTAEAYGIELAPYKRFQRYFTRLNLQRLMRENVAFKLSFGVLFTLSAFARFQ